AAMVGLVAPRAVAEQSLVDVAQRELPDLAHALGREVRASLALRHVARVDEQDHDLLQQLEVARRLRAEERAQALEIDRLEVPGEQRLLEALQALHLAHQLDRLAVGERLRALKEVAVTPLEVLEVADVLQLLEQVFERAARVVVREGMVAQLLERLGEARREAVQRLPLAGGGLAVDEAVERVALEVEQLLQLLAQLAESLAQVDLAIAASHCLAELLQEVVEPHDTHALLPLEPLVEEPVEGLLHVVGEGEVLGELLENPLRLEADLLRAVPGGIADAEHPAGP